MSAAGRPGGVVRVLLVDDAVDARRLVRTALRFRGGFEVTGEAGTCAQAAELAAELQPDVIVLDLGLPDLAGRDVLGRVRASAPAAKVVVFSGADPDDRLWFEENTAGYVLKNEDLDYLVDLLESAGRPEQQSVEVDLPQDLGSVRQARSLVRSTLDDWELGHLLDEACLVVSELATNALNHAESSFRVRVSLNPGTLRLEVADSGPGTPEPQPQSDTREGGRGLVLIAAMSASWGIEESARGKVVWAELAREVS
ncbi:ATP-binding protein [Nocardioides pantholopis]|uniref:ATP-binding protein n=1 Tax=Nocardioides pantholopis TaxID=2483798 RepID=UPI000F07CF22|nr:ATP-binding protein [Nocardioides pantholopis]